MTAFVLQASVIHAWTDHQQLIQEHAQEDGWEKLTPLSFEVFVVTLARAMLHYDGKKKIYPGEDILTSNTKVAHKRRATADTEVVVEEVTDAKKYAGRGQHKVRLIPDRVRYPTLSAELLPHFNLEQCPRRLCHHCGKQTYKWDPVCHVALHAGACMTAYHDRSQVSWEDTRQRKR